MALASGAWLGPYEILGPLGAGGMAEVYRARDSRLDRTVALKILPQELARFPGRRERFEREARAISSLNHPNICPLYDVGESDGVAYLVMQYLEGESLAQRLVRGPLPPEQVLRCAIEIGDALDHAHRRGVVHRDLKPSNVMLTASGAKLLDFGLAKLQPLDAMPLSTVSLPGVRTGEGTILGTLQYMAPEQLEARDVDARTDLFAFGAVVHEMATGRKAFEGGSQASLIAAILTAAPPAMSSLSALTPPVLDRVVARCLAKAPDDRWQTARDLTFAVRGIAEDAGAPTSAATAGAVRERRNPRAAWGWGLALLAAGLATGLTLWFRARVHDDSANAFVSIPLRAQVLPPADVTTGAMALSPDGRQLVFVGRGGGRTRLWIRALDGLEARPFAGTDGAEYPFWSPDGRSIGFFADGKLKRIDATGGPPRTLADAQAPRGGTWNVRDVIVFAPNLTGLRRVSANGGAVENVTTLDRSRGEQSHRWPIFLPDGERFLYLASSSRVEDRGLFAASLDGSLKKLIVRTNLSAAFASTGHLLFVRDGTLVAQPFLIRDLRLDAAPLEIAGPVAFDGLEHARFTVAAAGTLVYQPGGFTGGSEIVRFEHDGRRLDVVGSPADFRGIRLSPSGRRIAMVTEDPVAQTPDIWVRDLESSEAARFTFDVGTDNDPVWSPDSGRIAFRSTRGERFGLYVRPAGGAEREQTLLESSEAANAHVHDWSRDGRFALFSQVDASAGTDRDILVLPMEGDHTPRVLVASANNQDRPRFSANGRWVAYQTNETGSYRVYVVPFPATGGEWQASSAEGTQPLWSATGKELYYLSPDNAIMAVDVRETGSTIGFGTARPLFRVPVAPVPGWAYDVDPAGRFYVLVPTDRDVPMTLIANWLTSGKK